MTWYGTESVPRSQARELENGALTEHGMRTKFVGQTENYTVTNRDHGFLLAVDSGVSTRTITFPANLLPDFVCGIMQYGSGQVTIAEGAGVTIHEADDQYLTEKQYIIVSVAALRQDEYILTGRTAS